MKLKSYFSGTVEAAMHLARKELGDDALLVNARPATPETRSLGEFEVVFGIADTPPPPLSSMAPSQPQMGNLAADVADLRREIERISHMMQMAQMGRDHVLANHGLANSAQPGGETAVVSRSQVYADLLASELDPTLAV